MSNLSPQFQQLPMFMSAREIRSQYRALDGDRRTVNPQGRTAISESFRHQGTSLDQIRRDMGPWSKETDDQVFSRKYEESDETYVNDDETLHANVRRRGILDPINLTAPAPGSSMQVLGGHHRLAIADREFPDRLLPVEHYLDFDHALSSSPDYRPGKREY